MRITRILPLCGVAAAMLLTSPALAAEAGPAAVAVADFDYSDTSGEAADQTAQHRERMTLFATLLRETLQREHRVMRPACPQPACTATSMAADDLVTAARRDGARYLVYGGIRKMSTLVQWGEVQLLDVDRDRLVLRRTVTFRGDTDTAFRRAAAFVAETVHDAMAAQ